MRGGRKYQLLVIIEERENSGVSRESPSFGENPFLFGFDDSIVW